MRDFSRLYLTVAKRTAFLALMLIAGLAAFPQPSLAASPAEQFISADVQRGLTILEDKSLSKDEKRAKFQDFLLSLTNIRAIADYTLGQYRRSASPAELSAFEDAFKGYALSVYQTYFDKFTGQTLKVTGSYSMAPGEDVVKTVMIDPAKKGSGQPLEVDFRVKDKGGHMAVIDFSVAGVWLRETERSDFTSFLGQNNGNVAALTEKLKQKAEQE